MAANNSIGASGIRSMESNHKQLVVLRCKLVIVGEAAVGKTALTQVFTSGGPTFPKNYLMVRTDSACPDVTFSLLAANDSDDSCISSVLNINLFLALSFLMSRYRPWEQSFA